MVKLLLMYGADPEAVSKFNKTPRTIAQSEGFVELVYLMDNFNKEDDENLTISYVFQVKPECEEEDVAGETMSIFEVDDDEEEEEGEDDGVEVIPAADCNSIDISLDEPPPPPEDQSKAVAQDSDESISNLHETINKLGNIRGRSWIFRGVYLVLNVNPSSCRTETNGCDDVEDAAKYRNTDDRGPGSDDNIECVAERSTDHSVRGGKIHSESDPVQR